VFANVAKAGEEYTPIDESAYSRQARIDRQEEKSREIQLQRYQQQNYFRQQRTQDQLNRYNQVYHSRRTLNPNFDQGNR
jgi:hypothetical protein